MNEAVHHTPPCGYRYSKWVTSDSKVVLMGSNDQTSWHIVFYEDKLFIKAKVTDTVDYNNLSDYYKQMLFPDKWAEEQGLRVLIREDFDRPKGGTAADVSAQTALEVIQEEPLSSCCNALTFIDGSRRVCNKCRLSKSI